MTAIERDALMSHYGDAVALWVGFIAAVEEALRTYNAAHHARPVQITQRTPTCIVIVGQVVNSPDDIFAVRTVSVSAQWLESEVVIRCVIQSWAKSPAGIPNTIESEPPIEFKLSRGSLWLDNLKLTPIQAADKVLSKALLS